MKRHLPLLVERCIQDGQAARRELESTFERGLRLRRDTVTCLKGCNHCCYNPVSLSVLEGVTLFRWLSKHRMWTTALKVQFESVHARTFGLSAGVWLMSQIPCPLLDEDQGTCRAYEGRPLTCRVTSSTGDPYLCHPHRVSEATGIIPRREVLEKKATKEKALLQRLRVPHGVVPLATAVLLGEQIDKEEISIQDYPQKTGRLYLTQA